MATAQVVMPRGPPGKPDIDYAPDIDKYLARTRRRLATERLERVLPEDFPQRLESDLVWDGSDIADRYNWVYELTQSDIDEIEAALKHFKSLNQPLGYIDANTFPLPHLRPILRGISDDIHNAYGFKVLRGLLVQRHTREENIIIYAGVSAHIAPIRGRQDHEIDGRPADVVLNHIKDMTATVDAKHIGAPAYTTEKQVFHTDAGSIIALMCLETAAEGGQSKLSSSWKVYNELAQSRPDLIRTLAEPKWTPENFSGQGKQYSIRPLLHYQPKTGTTPERMIIQYARRTFTGYWGLPRSSNIPAITEAQAEALDALHFLAEKHAVSLDFRQGDVQYVNNLSIFHARDGFTDTSDKQRHLMRLWLRDPANEWKIPAELSQRWEHVYGGVTPEKTVFPLEPRIRSSSAGKATVQSTDTNGGGIKH